MTRISRFFLLPAICLLAALACARTDLPPDYDNVTPVGTRVTKSATALLPAATATLAPATLPVPGLPTATPRPTLDTSVSPTPDATRSSVLDRQAVEQYVVQSGDTLGRIGARYGVTPAEIAEANGLKVTDMLLVGQTLFVPLPKSAVYGSDLKILPDSELVYGPGMVGFNLPAYIESQSGYLARYREDVAGSQLDGTVDQATLSGAEIVQIVAERYSVSPRLLLALLEYQSGWLTKRQPDDQTLTYPLRRIEIGREGLMRQLGWAANQLNYGYYAWRAGSLVSFSFSDGALRVIARGLNSGTAGVQQYFAQVTNVRDWERAVAADGFSRTYRALFGNPFATAVDPLLPADLAQPVLQLPFEPAKVWAFTGGPHGAWDTGSAWGALDFAPPAAAEGCVTSDEWVTAAAPGIVVRSRLGLVAVDLDGDGYEGTGWVLLYAHIEKRDRVEVGTVLAVGDRLGHPSCEGGVANGTHVHLARKYNGEWIPADSALPFVLDGWVSAGLGKEYDGTLTKGDQALEACDCRAAGNEIYRP